MALAREELEPRLLTYEDYLAEGEVMARYDILDGERFMTNPTRRHQEILGEIWSRLQAYAKGTRSGVALMAPQDVLIRRHPLRVRQPDVLFITHERLAQCPGPDDPAPLPIAPELVVEILSPSERRVDRDQKLRDYCDAGGMECWVVSTLQQSVEVLRLSPAGAEPVAIYSLGDIVRSVGFPDLTVPVADVFSD
jgi:Uma2 family endonuclease